MTSRTPVDAAPEASLAGLRVAITRSADRAGALADALAAAGAEPVLVPLIDFEVSDPAVLDAGLARLAAGHYRWLVISSITTVRALKQACARAGTTLAELLPAGTSVATIGPTSAAVLAAEGLPVALAPTELQSAAGLVALWPAAPDATLTAPLHAPTADTRVLLPQSSLAEPTLVDGLRARGWTVDVLTAYATVDAPARPALRLTATLAHATATAAPGATPATHAPATLRHDPQLSLAEAAGELRAGRIDAVVLASGSAASRLAATLAPLPQRTLVIAIGAPTRATAERLGLRVAATAEHPTPAGIVAALRRATTDLSTTPGENVP